MVFPSRDQVASLPAFSEKYELGKIEVRAGVYRFSFTDSAIGDETTRFYRVSLY